MQAFETEVHSELKQRLAFLQLSADAKIAHVSSPCRRESSDQTETFEAILALLSEPSLVALEQTLRSIKSMLKIGGGLLFAIQEQGMLEMHDIGDALLKAGFKDPVVDREVFSDSLSVVFGYARRQAETSFQLENGDIAVPVTALTTQK